MRSKAVRLKARTLRDKAAVAKGKRDVVRLIDEFVEELHVDRRIRVTPEVKKDVLRAAGAGATLDVLEARFELSRPTLRKILKGAEQ